MKKWEGEHNALLAFAGVALLVFASLMWFALGYVVATLDFLKMITSWGVPL